WLLSPPCPDAAASGPSAASPSPSLGRSCSTTAARCSASLPGSAASRRTQRSSRSAPPELLAMAKDSTLVLAGRPRQLAIRLILIAAVAIAVVCAAKSPPPGEILFHQARSKFLRSLSSSGRRRFFAGSAALEKEDLVERNFRDAAVTAKSTSYARVIQEEVCNHDWRAAGLISKKSTNLQDREGESATKRFTMLNPENRPDGIGEPLGRWQILQAGAGEPHSRPRVSVPQLGHPVHHALELGHHVGLGAEYPTDLQAHVRVRHHSVLVHRVQQSDGRVLLSGVVPELALPHRAHPHHLLGEHVQQGLVALRGGGSCCYGGLILVHAQLLQAAPHGLDELNVARLVRPYRCMYRKMESWNSCRRRSLSAKTSGLKAASGCRSLAGAGAATAACLVRSSSRRRRSSWRRSSTLRSRSVARTEMMLWRKGRRQLVDTGQAWSSWRGCRTAAEAASATDGEGGGGRLRFKSSCERRRRRHRLMTLGLQSSDCLASDSEAPDSAASESDTRCAVSRNSSMVASVQCPMKRMKGRTSPSPGGAAVAIVEWVNVHQLPVRQGGHLHRVQLGGVLRVQPVEEIRHQAGHQVHIAQNSAVDLQQVVEQQGSRLSQQAAIEKHERAASRPRNFVVLKQALAANCDAGLQDGGGPAEARVRSPGCGSTGTPSGRLRLNLAWSICSTRGQSFALREALAWGRRRRSGSEQDVSHGLGIVRVELPGVLKQPLGLGQVASPEKLPGQPESAVGLADQNDLLDDLAWKMRAQLARLQDGGGGGQRHGWRRRWEGGFALKAAASGELRDVTISSPVINLRAANLNRQRRRHRLMTLGLQSSDCLASDSEAPDSAASESDTRCAVSRNSSMVASVQCPMKRMKGRTSPSPGGAAVAIVEWVNVHQLPVRQGGHLHRVQLGGVLRVQPVEEIRHQAGHQVHIAQNSAVDLQQVVEQQGSRLSQQAAIEKHESGVEAQNFVVLKQALAANCDAGLQDGAGLRQVQRVALDGVAVVHVAEVVLLLQPAEARVRLRDVVVLVHLLVDAVEPGLVDLLNQGQSSLAGGLGLGTAEGSHGLGIVRVELPGVLKQPLGLGQVASPEKLPGQPESAVGLADQVWAEEVPAVKTQEYAATLATTPVFHMWNNDDYLELRGRLVGRRRNAGDEAASVSTESTNASNPFVSMTTVSEATNPFLVANDLQRAHSAEVSTNPFLEDIDQASGQASAMQQYAYPPAHGYAALPDYNPVPALPPVPKPAPYNGREDFDDFLIRISAYISRFPGLRDADKINTLTAFLGPAFATYTTWLAIQCAYVGLPPGTTLDQLPGVRYEGLVEHLRSRHGGAKSAALLRREFRARQRRPEESFETYLTELQRLAARAYPDPRAQAYVQQTVSEQFMHGLNDGYVTERLLNQPTPPSTVEQVLRIAQQLRETRAYMDAGRGEIQPQQPRPPQSQLSAPPKPLMPQQPASSGGRGQQRQQSPASSNCFGCGQPGHIRRNCPNAEGAALTHSASTPRLSSCQPGQVRFVTARILRRRRHCLIDTGAEVSCISDDICKKARRRLQPSSIIIRGTRLSHLTWNQSSSSEDDTNEDEQRQRQTTGHRRSVNRQQMNGDRTRPKKLLISASVIVSFMTATACTVPFSIRESPCRNPKRMQRHVGISVVVRGGATWIARLSLTSHVSPCCTLANSTFSSHILDDTPSSLAPSLLHSTFSDIHCCVWPHTKLLLLASASSLITQAALSFEPTPSMSFLLKVRNLAALSLANAAQRRDCELSAAASPSMRWHTAVYWKSEHWQVSESNWATSWPVESFVDMASRTQSEMPNGVSATRTAWASGRHCGSPRFCHWTTELSQMISSTQQSRIRAQPAMSKHTLSLVQAVPVSLEVSGQPVHSCMSQLETDVDELVTEASSIQLTRISCGRNGVSVAMETMSDPRSSSDVWSLGDGVLQEKRLQLLRVVAAEMTAEASDSEDSSQTAADGNRRATEEATAAAVAAQPPRRWNALGSNPRASAASGWRTLRASSDRCSCGTLPDLNSNRQRLFLSLQSVSGERDAPSNNVDLFVAATVPLLTAGLSAGLDEEIVGEGSRVDSGRIGVANIRQLLPLRHLQLVIAAGQRRGHAAGVFPVVPEPHPRLQHCNRGFELVNLSGNTLPSTLQPSLCLLASSVFYLKGMSAETTWLCSRQSLPLLLLLSLAVSSCLGASLSPTGSGAVSEPADVLEGDWIKFDCPYDQGLDKSKLHELGASVQDCQQPLELLQDPGLFTRALVAAVLGKVSALSDSMNSGVLKGRQPPALQVNSQHPLVRDGLVEVDEARSSVGLIRLRVRAVTNRTGGLCAVCGQTVSSFGYSMVKKTALGIRKPPVASLSFVSQRSPAAALYSETRDAAGARRLELQSGALPGWLRCDGAAEQLTAVRLFKDDKV
uniref:CCHC-type domain-containing protein n=1 Tax=Macrostomum lignano TaxID=282301 RepID=A0A1I8IK94_9PLAT